MLFGGAFTLAHDRRLMIEHFFGDADMVRVAERGHHQRSLWREVVQWSKRWSTYVMLVEIPSVVLPLLFELLMPFMQLPVWTFWVVVTEMLISIRLLHEGTLVPALKRVVAVIDAATPNMIALVVVLAPLTALTSLMHSQLFGLFDEGFSDPFVSLTRIINMLTAPPPQQNTEGKIFQSQEKGAELLFYWSTFVIRLCFGSFIVAVLVSAFNKVVSNEAATKQTQIRDASLPPGFTDATHPTGCESACDFADYFFTARLYGSYEPRLVNSIETQIALTEFQDETGTAKKEQLLVDVDELAEMVGDKPALLLLRDHGVVELQAERALDA